MRLLETTPQLSLALTRTLANLLRESRPPPQTSRPLPVTLALVALDDGVPLRHIGRRLADALARHMHVVLLEGSEVAPPPAGTEPAAAYGAVLDRAEHDHDLVVLLAGTGSGGTPWTEFCLQQADRLLAVSSGAAPRDESADRPELRGCDLVGLGVREGSGALSGWAARLDPIESHLLRPGPRIEDDLQRMARRLTGRSVGIVLSGGGARAFSHIGVLEELTAAGITIDRVAGVSMGAYVGAMFAMGMNGDEMDAQAYEEWVRRRPLTDYTVPRYALLRG